MAVVAHYTGDGSEYLNGIPATDLEEEDFRVMTDEQKALVVASPLYEIEGRSKAAQEAKAAAKKTQAQQEEAAAAAASETSGDAAHGAGGDE